MLTKCCNGRWPAAVVRTYFYRITFCGILGFVARHKGGPTPLSTGVSILLVTLFQHLLGMKHFLLYIFEHMNHPALRRRKMVNIDTDEYASVLRWTRRSGTWWGNSKYGNQKKAMGV